MPRRLARNSRSARLAVPLLLVVAACAVGTASLANDAEPKQKRPIRGILKDRTSVEFNGTKLSEAIKSIEKQHGLPIAIDERELQKQGLDSTAQVSSRLHGISLGSALTLMLESLGLAWEIADNGIKITTAEKKTAAPVVLTIYVLDAEVEKVYKGIDARQAKMEFLDTIFATIDPTSWKSSGGRGNATWPLQGLLLVNEPSVQAQMKNLVLFLNQSNVHSLDLNDTPVRSRVRATLEEPTDFVFLDTPLFDAIAFLGDYHDLNVLTDKKAILGAGIRSDAPITDRAEGVRLSQALDRILKPLDLDYIIQHEVLKITSRKKAASLLETHIYNVKQLVGQNVKPAIVTNYIAGTVMPESWSKRGGPGTLASLPGYLLVYQTQRAHREIPKRLMQLKRRLDEKADDGK